MSVCRFLILRLEKSLLRESLVKAARSAEKKVMVLVAQRHRCILEQAYQRSAQHVAHRNRLLAPINFEFLILWRSAKVRCFEIMALDHLRCRRDIDALDVARTVCVAFRGC